MNAQADAPWWPDWHSMAAGARFVIYHDAQNATASPLRRAAAAALKRERPKATDDERDRRGTERLLRLVTMIRDCIDAVAQTSGPATAWGGVRRLNTLVRQLHIVRDGALSELVAAEQWRQSLAGRTRRAEGGETT